MEDNKNFTQYRLKKNKTKTKIPLLGFEPSSLILSESDLVTIRPPIYYTVCLGSKKLWLFVSSSWEPSLHEPRDMWMETIYLEGEPLTRNIEGVMPSQSFKFYHKKICFTALLTFRSTFLHDYWVKSKFRAYSFIKNWSLYEAVSLEFWFNPIVVEKSGPEGQKGRETCVFLW